MGDHTYGYMIIIGHREGASPETVAAQLRVLLGFLRDEAEYEFEPEFTAGDPINVIGMPATLHGSTDLAWDQGLSLPEIRVGRVEDDGPKLAEHTPDLLWWLSEDPVGDIAGAMMIHAPDLGVFTWTSDTTGGPIYSRNEVLDMLAADDQDEVRRTKLGTPWFEAIEAHRQRVQVAIADLIRARHRIRAERGATQQVSLITQHLRNLGHHKEN